MVIYPVQNISVLHFWLPYQHVSFHLVVLSFSGGWTIDAVGYNVKTIRMTRVRCLFSRLIGDPVLSFFSVDEFHLRGRFVFCSVWEYCLPWWIDVRHFPASLYCLYAICVFYYVAIFPFIALAQLLFESKYGLSPAWSNACNSLVYFMQVLFNCYCMMRELFCFQVSHSFTDTRLYNWSNWAQYLLAYW
jgi:hypothetical protein